MASIRVRVHQGRRQVTVRGRLVAADLRRLEHACGPALEQPEAPLEVRLERPSDVDEPAKLFLARLARRGAVLT